MMKRKLLGVLLAVLMVCSVFALTACDEIIDSLFGGGATEPPTNDERIMQVYELYVDYAASNGEVPLSYEDWLATVKGKDGKDGKDGKTPMIGYNGNWWIDGKDTGVPAIPKDGENGKDGVGIEKIEKISSEGLVDTYEIAYTTGTKVTFTVTNGADGEKGEDGATPQLRIVDGYWEVSYDNGENWISLGVAATGPKGDTGNGISSIVKTKTEGLVDTYTITFTNGDTTTFTVTNGADGAQGIQGIQGEKGADGHTPVITIQNGKWYIDGIDSGKSAEGIKGDTGNGISSIAKTNTEGLVDTYTITFTNGETTTFTVTNGATGAQGQQGVQGIQGEKGEDGHTPVITIQNGKWYIDGVDSGKSAEGVKGDTGNGISSIAKTNTEGLVDTYTITFTNGETTTFTVTNGATGAQGQQGIQGIQGEKGEDGHTPVITIQNGKWYIDGVDSGKSAEGIKGDTGNGISSITKTNTVGLIDIYTITFTNGDTSTFTVTNGADGEQGVQGIQGEKGEDGHTPVITIQNGKWYIDGVDSGKSAEAVKGDTGNGISSIAKTKTEGLVDTYTITFTNGDTTIFTVTNGADGAQGQQGVQGIQGEKGEDGHTPVITIQNGKWYIDGVDSGKSAEGVKGDTGNGISNITKTKTEGLVDTYTITYTNGTTTTFTVTNGANGQQGIQGEKGDDGHTPVITIQNGRWYIDGVDTGKSAEGVKGDDGLSAFEIYQKYHPEYTGTEEEWIESLKGEQGVSITNAYVDKNLHLWIVLSNGTKIDAGYVGVTVNPSPLTYTVTFVDYDGTVLKTETVEHGKNAAPPTDPVRTNYQFVGWDIDYSNVTADIIVKAEYTSLLPTISIENIQVSKETSEVTFDVCVKNNPGIMNMVLSMTIDDVVFNFKTAVKGDALPSSAFTKPGTQASSSPYRFLLDAMEITNDDKEDGVIFTVTLSVDDLTAVGEYEVELTYVVGDIVDENFEEINIQIENGTIILE